METSTLRNRMPVSALFDPKIVVTVLVEFGGSGGAASAPLAGQIFDLYRKKYDR